MKGVIANYRRGRHTMYSNQAIVVIEGVSSRADAAKLVGKRVIWTSPSGKKIIGKITAPHGNKGAVRVRFRKGLPGQAIGAPVEIE